MQSGPSSSPEPGDLPTSRSMLSRGSDGTFLSAVMDPGHYTDTAQSHEQQDLTNAHTQSSDQSSDSIILRVEQEIAAARNAVNNQRLAASLLTTTPITTPRTPLSPNSYRSAAMSPGSLPNDDSSFDRAIGALQAEFLNPSSNHLGVSSSRQRETHPEETNFYDSSKTNKTTTPLQVSTWEEIQDVPGPGISQVAVRNMWGNTIAPPIAARQLSNGGGSTTGADFVSSSVTGSKPVSGPKTLTQATSGEREEDEADDIWEGVEEQNAPSTPTLSPSGASWNATAASSPSSKERRYRMATAIRMQRNKNTPTMQASPGPDTISPASVPTPRSSVEAKVASSSATVADLRAKAALRKKMQADITDGMIEARIQLTHSPTKGLSPTNPPAASNESGPTPGKGTELLPSTVLTTQSQAESLALPSLAGTRPSTTTTDYQTQSAPPVLGSPRSSQMMSQQRVQPTAISSQQQAIQFSSTDTSKLENRHHAEPPKQHLFSPPIVEIIQEHAPSPLMRQSPSKQLQQQFLQQPSLQHQSQVHASPQRQRSSASSGETIQTQTLLQQRSSPSALSSIQQQQPQQRQSSGNAEEIVSHRQNRPPSPSAGAGGVTSPRHSAPSPTGSARAMTSPRQQPSPSVGGSTGAVTTPRQQREPSLSEGTETADTPRQQRISTSSDSTEAVVSPRQQRTPTFSDSAAMVSPRQQRAPISGDSAGAIVILRQQRAPTASDSAGAMASPRQQRAPSPGENAAISSPRQQRAPSPGENAGAMISPSQQPSSTPGKSAGVIVSPSQQRAPSPSETPPKQQRAPSPSETPPKQQRAPSPSETAPKQQRAPPPSEFAPKQQRTHSASETASKQQQEPYSTETSPTHQREPSPSETALKQQREPSPSETAPKQQLGYSPSETAPKQLREPSPSETPLRQHRAPSPSETAPKQHRAPSPNETAPKQQQAPSPANATRRTNPTPLTTNTSAVEDAKTFLSSPRSTTSGMVSSTASPLSISGISNKSQAAAGTHSVVQPPNTGGGGETRETEQQQVESLLMASKLTATQDQQLASVQSRSQDQQSPSSHEQSTVSSPRSIPIDKRSDGVARSKDGSSASKVGNNEKPSNNSIYVSVQIPESAPKTKSAVSPTTSMRPASPASTQNRPRSVWSKPSSPTNNSNQPNPATNNNQPKSSRSAVPPEAQPSAPAPAPSKRVSNRIKFRDPFPVLKAPVQVRPASDIIAGHTTGKPNDPVRWIKPQSDLKQLIVATMGSSLQRRSNACGALKVLLSGSRKNQMAMVRTDSFLASLVYAASQPIPSSHEREMALDARTRALACISYVCEPKENRTVVVMYPGMVECLIKVISEDDGEARCLACGACALIAKSLECREAMVDEHQLVNLLAEVLGKKFDPERNTGASFEMKQPKRRSPVSKPVEEKKECEADELLEKRTPSSSNASMRHKKSASTNSGSDDDSAYEEHHNTNSNDLESLGDEEEATSSHRSRSVGTHDDETLSLEDDEIHGPGESGASNEDGGGSSTNTEKENQRHKEIASIRVLNKEKNKEFFERARSNSCAVLLHLAKHCAVSNRLCTNNVVLSNVLKVANEKSSPFHTKCLEIILHFTRFPPNIFHLTTFPNMIPSLMDAGDSEVDEDRALALRCFQNLSTEQGSKLKLATDIILSFITSCAMRVGEDEKEAAVSTLYNLTTEPGAVVAITNTKNAVATLVHLAHNPTSTTEVRLRSSEALATISLWLQTLAGTGKVPEGEHHTLPTQRTTGWERWD